MCMQCVANSAVYLGGAVGGLQVLRIRAVRRRRAAAQAQPVERSDPETLTPA